MGALLWTVGSSRWCTSAPSGSVLRFPGKHRLMLHSTLVAMLGVLCIVAGFVIVRRGVSPIAELRERLAGVREGRTRTIDGNLSQ
jgi:hypothetical protein